MGQTFYYIRKVGIFYEFVHCSMENSVLLLKLSPRNWSLLDSKKKKKQFYVYTRYTNLLIVLRFIDKKDEQIFQQLKENRKLESNYVGKFDLIMKFEMSH